ncbi:glycoside hydrolase family 32 protein [Caulobacter sp. LARHSG274]
MRRVTVLLAALLLCTPSLVAHAQDAVTIGFDEAGFPGLHSQWPTEIVPGAQGGALRTDGFTTWWEQPLQLEGSRFVGASLWAALESYPSDREVPAREATPASFLNQADGKRGFDLYIDTYGRWGLRLATSRGMETLAAPARFPVYQWTKIGFSADPATGTIALFQDGKVVSTGRFKAGAAWLPAQAPLKLARSWRDAKMGEARVNLLNGAFDDLTVSQDVGRADALQARDAEPAASISQSLATPASRFAADPLRPRFHAIPPANWTNEPHGLVLVNGRYHLFYQRTPNGPFKTQMHWGHMSSPDLVNWTHQRDALFPTLQTDTVGFDMKGIWSGDVIVSGGQALAYYTSVNHGGVFNPGVSVAVSNDPKLQHWEKRGPILDTAQVRDFRDPYLWKEDGAWNMIIGAAYEGHGGLDYYRCEDGDGPTCWKHRDRFAATPFQAMDEPGSTIWEMPVFEALGDRRVLVANPIGGRISKYGLAATRAVYWVGEWAHGAFTPDASAPQPLDVIPGHLSPAVARRPDGVLVGIGIVDERRSPQAQIDAGWAHTFSLPREWFLTSGGHALGQRPIEGLKTLRADAVGAAQSSLVVRGERLLGDFGRQAELQARFVAGARAPYGVVIGASPDGQEQTQILYDPATREIVVDKSRSTLSMSGEGPEVLRGKLDTQAFGEPLAWRVFVDGSVVDVFLGNGAAFSFRIYPSRADASLIGLAAQDIVTVESATMWRLKAAKVDYDLD